MITVHPQSCHEYFSSCETFITRFSTHTHTHSTMFSLVSMRLHSAHAYIMRLRARLCVLLNVTSWQRRFFVFASPEHPRLDRVTCCENYIMLCYRETDMRPSACEFYTCSSLCTRRTLAKKTSNVVSVPLCGYEVFTARSWYDSVMQIFLF